MSYAAGLQGSLQRAKLSKPVVLAEYLIAAGLFVWSPRMVDRGGTDKNEAALIGPRLDQAQHPQRRLTGKQGTSPRQMRAAPSRPALPLLGAGGGGAAAFAAYARSGWP